MDLQSNVRVDGGADGVGLYYPVGTGDPSVQTPNTLDGVQPSATTSFYDDSPKYVFGVPATRLNSMADLYLTDPADFPAEVSFGTVTVLETATPIVFTNARPLKGFGMVVIRGDVVIETGSSSIFLGLLYVDGNLTMNAPCSIKGAIIVTGSLLAKGSGDYVDVLYDDAVINQMQLTMANYRISRSPRRRTQHY